MESLALILNDNKIFFTMFRKEIEWKVEKFVLRVVSIASGVHKTQKSQFKLKILFDIAVIYRRNNLVAKFGSMTRDWKYSCSSKGDSSISEV